MKFKLAALFLCTFFFVGSVMADAMNDTEKFRKDSEESLKKNWLVVVGLSWLKEGENTLGSAAEAQLRLPSMAPAQLARIFLKQKKAQVEFLHTDGVLLDGKPVVKGRKYDLQTDKEGRECRIQTGTMEMFLIERAHGVGLRVKDSQSETLKAFKGKKWWPIKKEYVIEGKWNKLPNEKILRVPDIQGEVTEEKITGSVLFKIKDQTYELFPTLEGDRLFFVFKDLTSGKQSYGTGRFLYSQLDKNGKVILDFNRAVNPPCAQIQFATCPIAPFENTLKVAIEAGEMAPDKKH